ncbi:neutrophilic granule protein [Sigmodon hispidus]
MARLWTASVLVVALAVVACEDQDPLIYKDIVEQAVEAYNNGRPGKPLFRLIDFTAPSDQNPTSNIPLKFMVVETNCISTLERQPKNCNFLENGVSVFSQPPDCLAEDRKLSPPLAPSTSLGHFSTSTFNTDAFFKITFCVQRWLSA